jgi:Fe-S-cluster containining protein
VWINDGEATALARAVGLSEAMFREKYARRIGRRWSLIERKTEHGYDCVFLDRSSVPGKAVCSVYQARPTQCRTWPFWPENLESSDAWDQAKQGTPCPGMNRGTLIPIESIRVQRNEMEAR